ncbi:hypothetical protein CHARACLAT_027507 [Characodon lateralis]|uniref:Uncharacterized protein n=1 Tax=Characodon lateralis TaxID=208331 RepID=A0ABU7DKD3_9TELE|nr:hypothetical protein [Characodon lateralis]
MWGLFPPSHTPCLWLISLSPGVLGVLSSKGWVLCVCRLTPGGCLPGPGPLGSVGLLLAERCVPGSRVHGWICSGGAYGPWFSWGSPALGGLWMSVARISCVSVSVSGGQICGSSHSLLHIFMEKPCIHKRAHT